MADPFLGEIRPFAFGVIPRGWLPCEGQVLPINQNQALFSLLGTTYGGNGVNTFQLPDLRGRLPLGSSQNYPPGTVGGEATHTLTVNETPAHTHMVQASSATGTLSTLQGNYWAGAMNYAAAPDTAMAPDAIGAAGQSQPHENMQPYMAVSFCIATNGIFPSRN
jgi:microcystin-dependent protein